MTTTYDSSSWPDFLTVEQAAVVLRIGRTVAYELARRYLETDGADGLPVIRIGRQLRVPRPQLERWHGGPLTPPVTSLGRRSLERSRVVPLARRRRARGVLRRGDAGSIGDVVDPGTP